MCFNFVNTDVTKCLQKEKELMKIKIIYTIATLFITAIVFLIAFNAASQKSAKAVVDYNVVQAFSGDVSLSPPECRYLIIGIGDANSTIEINLKTGEVKYDCNDTIAANTFWKVVSESYLQSEIGSLRNENEQLRNRIAELETALRQIIDRETFCNNCCKDKYIAEKVLEKSKGN